MAMHKRTVGLKKGRDSGEKPKFQQRGPKHSARYDTPERFVVCINLGNVPPENLNATITGQTVNITGERVELHEEDGMIRKNYHGFSNTFNIPPEVDIDTLKLTICEEHTLLVEADYFESIATLEEYSLDTEPRPSHLKSSDKLSFQEASSLDLASWPTNISSEISQDSLYETALTPNASRKSFIAKGDPSRRASISEERGLVSQPAASRSSFINKGSNQSMHQEGRKHSTSHPVESRRMSMSPEQIQDMQEEGRRGSDFYQGESRRPSIRQERIQSLQEEGKRGSVPHLIESDRSLVSAERIQNRSEKGRRGSVQHPESRSSMNLERVQGEEKRSSIFQHGQSQRSSMGSKTWHIVYEEGKKCSINEHRRSSTIQVPGNEKRCPESHQEESRISSKNPKTYQSIHNKMKRESKCSTRDLTSSTEKSTNSNETSLDSSYSTISNSSQSSSITDDGEITVSIPASLQSKLSISSKSRLSPNSFSSQQNPVRPRVRNQLASAASSTTLVKYRQRSKAAKKEKTLSFDTFPFCCCPQ